jgi:predicted phosphodiesterase
LTNELINDDNRAYLRSLPAHIRIEFQLNEDLLTLLLVHGSPRRINEYLFEDRAEKSMMRIMEKANADIMCFGHTHIPYHRIFENPEGHSFRHAINIGSVGKPKDKDNRGGYVILTINKDSTLVSEQGIQVDFIRFEYDIEKAANAVENSILPDSYAQNLRQGY